METRCLSNLERPCRYATRFCPLKSWLVDALGESPQFRKGRPLDCWNRS